MNRRCEIPWKAMAILVAQPDATEEDLQNLFGNGRASLGLHDTNGTFGDNVVVLCIEKETYPIKCYVSWNGF